MKKIIIVDGNSDDKDQIRNYLVKGERGYSAYDLYVQNGGTLTEEQWLDAFLNANNYYSKTETDTLLNNKVNVSDIIDALNNTATNKPLSANQGKALKDLIDALTTTVETKANSSDVYEKSDVYTKTQANSTFKSVTDFRVITGTGSGNSSISINYPHNFDATNCVVISFLFKTSSYYQVFPNLTETETLGVYTYGQLYEVRLTDNDIKVYFDTPSLGSYEYKLVLMRTS